VATAQELGPRKRREEASSLGDADVRRPGTRREKGHGEGDGG